MEPRINLLGLSRDELVAFVSELGEPGYRGRQLFAALHDRRLRSFDEITDLPKALRAKLAERAAVSGLSLESRYISADGTRRYLMKTPDNLPVETVFIPEGPKDVNRLWDVKLPATTNCAGAGKWREEYTAQLLAAGCKNVIILPDNDPPGDTHGRQVARSCHDAGLIVKLIPLPGLPPKGDVSDFLDQHSTAELLAIVKDAPLFKSSTLVATPPALTLTSLTDLRTNYVLTPTAIPQTSTIPKYWVPTL